MASRSNVSNHVLPPSSQSRNYEEWSYVYATSVLGKCQSNWLFNFVCSSAFSGYGAALALALALALAVERSRVRYGRLREMISYFVPTELVTVNLYVERRP
jgi:hypothetical protein